MTSVYQPLPQLTGPRDAVLSLAFSAKAKFLSAAGYSGVCVWDLATSTSPPLPHMLFAPQNPKYIITASVWIYFQKNNRHVLILGSMRGDILLWDWNEEARRFNLLYRVHPMNDTQDEILSIDVYEHEVASGRIGRVVASTANQYVSIWTLQSKCVKRPEIFLSSRYMAVKCMSHCHIAVIRTFMSSARLCLDYKTGSIKSRKSPGPGRMGSVALSNACDKFVAYTGKNFQLYHLGNLEILKNFTAEVPLVLFPKQVVFGESETIVVGGTDRGCVLVYDVETEEVIQRLNYPDGSLVQPVSTFTVPGRHLIAIAGSTQEQPAHVILFEKHLAQVPQDVPSGRLAGDIRNGTSSQADSTLSSIHIGFYLPRIVLRWMWIIAVLVPISVAVYSTIPNYLTQVCILSQHTEGMIFDRSR
ncbi:MAG: WD40-repeat-containing domain protein [Lentinula lateritia]|nr:MAG: WD40-repeat-containing domain protein [Lentinula lateritia]